MRKLNNSYQTHCLYFSANSLSRCITEMADEAFRMTDLAPSYAHLMLLVIENPGSTQNDLSKMMNLKPSTMTRFFDKLIQKGYVERIHKGREVNIYATENGVESKVLINQALDKLYKRYCEVLGEEFALKLTCELYKATEIINE